jgi:predicted aminopeptidase
MKQLIYFSLFCFCSLLLAACSQLDYYSQSISGHLSIMSASRPIAEVLSDPETSDSLKQRLTLAALYRRYASEVLHLPDNNSYRSYADIGRSSVVWNVVAAPDDSLIPKQWCFAFVGCLPYRGYYAQAEAETYGAELATEGLDVLTYGVPAYSTLGWFDDPLLNTVVALPDWGLAGIMFHELAHQLIYVEDDSSFNEAFAQMVEEEGWRRWLARHGTDEQKDLYQLVMVRKTGFRELLEETRSRLQGCYAPDKEHAVRIECKQRTLDRMQQQYLELKKSWGGYDGYDAWFKSHPNNANFVSVQTYRHYLPAFETLLSQREGDLLLFYAEVARLAELPYQERQKIMEELLLSEHETL